MVKYPPTLEEYAWKDLFVGEKKILLKELQVGFRENTSISVLTKLFNQGLSTKKLP
jgi:hypothetical protein